MHFQSLYLLPCALIPLVQASGYTTSPKRGLVYIPNAATPQDNSIWAEAGSDLTWYYNYGPTPTLTFANNMQFVPMLFAASDNTFYNTVKTQISAGSNISYVLSFNEPDGTTSTGGSSISPQTAAAAWMSQLAPLQAMGVKVGAPAVTGSQQGINWLANFFAACTNCTADFMTLHFYGDFGGLANYMGQISATYPNKTMWITEFADPNDSSLTDEQGYFNTTLQYFDRLSYVTHYSYFGSFRSSTSNVGKNAAMLTSDGKLTDIGSWYLGMAATGNIPNSASSMGAASILLLAVGMVMLVVL